jgi:hypothetical protein
MGVFELSIAVLDAQIIVVEGPALAFLLPKRPVLAKNCTDL